MALTANTRGFSMGVSNFLTFFLTTDATAAVKTYFHLGFLPRYVKFVNLTDRIIDEFCKGMANDKSLHTVAAGTVTYPASGGITLEDGTLVSTALSVVTPDGALALSPASGTFIVEGFSVPAALMVASKDFFVLAHA